MKKATVLGWFGTAALAVAFLAGATPAPAASPEVENVRQAIKARGGRWHADDTSVSGLSDVEKKKRLGLHVESATAVLGSTTDPAPVPTVTAAPPTLDWRNTDGLTYVSPVKNQGSCGSCWAFAATAGIESQMMLGTNGSPVDLSEQILLSCSGAGSCSGGAPTTASNYLRDVGIPPESYFRYTAADTACTSASLDWQSQTQKITAWHRPTVSTTLVDAMKDALYAYGPIIAGMYVYNDFYSYRSGVYSYVSGAYAGSHAVLVVGYDDVQQAFIVKNSWGTGWGESGYFHIAYSEVAGTSKFGTLLTLVYDGYAGTPPAPDTTAPVATVTSPASGTTVAGTTTVSVSASDAVGVASVKLYLDGTLLGTASAGPFSFTWNTLAAVNGAHTLQAVAYDTAGNAGSSAQVGVTVNNVADTTPPTVAVASPANGTTVSKTVKIKVNASDGSTLQRVEAYADGVLLGTATCAATPCTASFSWNAAKAAKGAHNITAYAYDAAANKGTGTVTVYK